MDRDAFFWPIQLEYMAKYIGIGSFVIGSLFFTAYLTAPSDRVLMLGFYYVLGAGLVNGCMFLLLLLGAALYRLQKKNLLQTAVSLLINIPIVVLYVFILFTRGI